MNARIPAKNMSPAVTHLAADTPADSAAELAQVLHAIDALLDSLGQSAAHEHVAASTADKLARLTQHCGTLKKALAEEQDRSLVTLASISDGVLLTDLHGHITFMNKEAQRLTGHVFQEIASMSAIEIAILVDESSNEILPMHPVTQCRMQKSPVSSSLPVLLCASDFRQIPVEYTVSPILRHQTELVGVVMILRDVSAAREAAHKMAWQVTHDALTDLWSRNEFERRLDMLIRAPRPHETPHCLLYLDLDQFKVVNDTCGHAAGDEMLRQITYLMHQEIRQTDIFARLGGDEFGILLVDCPLEAATQIADKLRSTVRDFRFVWKNRLFETGASIGLVMLDEHLENASNALSQADMACYTAKDKGRNFVHVVVANDAEFLRRQNDMHWASRISMALDENRFRLYAQEIRPLGNELDPHLEVLLRMIDETGAEIPPGAFIPAAERYGLMNRIDRWVIRNTLAALVACNCRQGEIKLAINLSGLSLIDRELPGTVRKMLRDLDISPQAICFEITETAAISNLTPAMLFIEEFRALGCQFALDDFGSGMSSFGYLKSLPVDYLKIDGAFVRDIVNDPVDRIFVETIHRIGQAMHKKTIAEYVENQEIIDVLAEIGVDYIQGYGVSRPMPLEDWLNTIAFSVAPVDHVGNHTG